MVELTRKGDDMIIIDARTASSAKNGRPYTFSTAVADALDGMEPGNSIEVSAWLDHVGRQKKRMSLDVMVAKHKGHRFFTCQAITDGVRITRIA